MDVDHGGTGDKSPPEFGAWGLSPQILSYCKILSTRLLALQCTKMCFLPLQQDFYSKSRHASPHNSSQIYAYDPRRRRAAGHVGLVDIHMLTDRRHPGQLVRGPSEGPWQHVEDGSSVNGRRARHCTCAVNQRPLYI